MPYLEKNQHYALPNPADIGCLKGLVNDSGVMNGRLFFKYMKQERVLSPSQINRMSEKNGTRRSDQGGFYFIYRYYEIYDEVGWSDVSTARTRCGYIRMDQPYRRDGRRIYGDNNNVVIGEIVIGDVRVYPIP